MQNDIRLSRLEESLLCAEDVLGEIERFVGGLQRCFRTVATDGIDSLLQKEVYVEEILFRETKEDGPSAYSYDIEVIRIKDGKRACYEILLDVTFYYSQTPGNSKYRVNYVNYSNKTYLQKALGLSLMAGAVNASRKETNKLRGG